MAAKVQVVLSRTDIANLMSGDSGAVHADVFRRANRVLNKARILCPVDQGTLRASLHVDMARSGGNIVARIGSNLPYALYVHEGTGVYAGQGRIYPRNGRVLRWPQKNNSGSGNRRYKGGATSGFAYARSIAGMKGTPYLADALPAAAD